MIESTSAADGELTLVIDEATSPANDIVALTLVHPSGDKLPEWTPGAHIDLVLGDKLIRQYSLCGDPADRTRYRVAVLREPNGRGGSAHVHTHLTPGTKVTVCGPRNHFTLHPAPAYLFIAGGIGITPILPMIARADEEGANWRLLYGGRRTESMAFRDELQTRYGDRVTSCPQDTHGLLDLATAVDDLAAGTLVYCCGPEPLLDAVDTACQNLPDGTLHVERFSAKPLDEPIRNGDFEVVLQRSGLTLTVPPDLSILEVVTAAGVDVTYSCEDGICGSCETPVLAGTPDHRDSVLDDDEKARNDAMMICVSRSCSARIELDL